MRRMPVSPMVMPLVRAESEKPLGWGVSFSSGCSATHRSKAARSTLAR